VDSPFFKYFIFFFISLGTSLSKHNVPQICLLATELHSIQHCYSMRGIWKVMPPRRHLMEVVWLWSGTCPNLVNTVVCNAFISKWMTCFQPYWRASNSGQLLSSDARK
jgi:hypothetical protein